MAGSYALMLSFASVVLSRRSRVISSGNLAVAAVQCAVLAIGAAVGPGSALGVLRLGTILDAAVRPRCRAVRYRARGEGGSLSRTRIADAMLGKRWFISPFICEKLPAIHPRSPCLSRRLSQCPFRSLSLARSLALSLSPPSHPALRPRPAEQTALDVSRDGTKLATLDVGFQPKVLVTRWDKATGKPKPPHPEHDLVNLTTLTIDTEGQDIS